MLTYQAFIDEMPTIIVRANTLGVPAELSDDQEFRRSCHQLTHLIEMTNLHYNTVRCDSQVRRDQPH